MSDKGVLAKEGKKEKKVQVKIPSAFVGLTIVLLFMAVLTWVVPSGQFETETVDGNEVPISGTYHQIPKIMTEPDGAITDHRQGFFDVATSPLGGMEKGLQIILFILILGGFLNVAMKTGAMEGMFGAILKKLKGRERLLIPILMIFFALGGTTYGMQEETVAFYPLVVPLLMAAGYNAMTGVMVIVLGAGSGVLGSTVNPFSTAIASNSAGISVAEGMGWRALVLVLVTGLAIAYTMWYAAKVKAGAFTQDTAQQAATVKQINLEDIPVLTGKRKAVLAVFWGTMAIMVISLMPWEDWGVTVFKDFHDALFGVPILGPILGHVTYLGNWYFTEISGLFLLTAILMGLIYRKEFKAEGVKFVETFIKGCEEILTVCLIIAVATGISVIMSNGAIQDTIINWGADLLQNVNAGVAGVIAFVFYLPMSILIPSTSGLAAASMPIIAPIADLIDVPKHIIVTAFATSEGVVNMFAPTVASLMGGLTLAGVSYASWLKRSWPFLVAASVVSLAVVWIATVV